MQALPAGARPLVISSQSRPDVPLSLVAAQSRRAGPHVAGVLLADGEGERG